MRGRKFCEFEKFTITNTSEKLKKMGKFEVTNRLDKLKELCNKYNKESYQREENKAYILQ